MRNNGILKDIDSLIFANDSCYGPLFELEPIFAKLDRMNVDFWGITKNKFGMRKQNDKYIVCVRPHLQSYFLVFNKNVFENEVFTTFINSIKVESEKNDVVISYEIGLFELLNNSGFKSDFYIKDFYNYSNATILKWRQLITKSKCPFIKCSILRKVYNSS